MMLRLSAICPLGCVAVCAAAVDATDKQRRQNKTVLFTLTSKWNELVFTNDGPWM
jgi:hypothetical protein